MKLSENFAHKYGMDSYSLVIGKSSGVPYLIDETGKSSIFTGKHISESKHNCIGCQEPITAKFEHCPWCRITEADKYNAAVSNPFRVLDAHGLLEEYLENADKVGQDNDGI